MDISIVIVSYNTKNLLSDCLGSIEVAKQKLDIEVFVVDNASTDGTDKLFESKFKNVNFIKNKLNLGFSKANNIALKKAKGKYILVLNPDTKLLPDTLTIIYKFMEKSKDNVGMATCRVEMASGKIDPDSRRAFPTPWKSFCHFARLSKIFPNSSLFNGYYLGHINDNIEHEVEACAGAFMFIKSNALKKVGMFDEDFFFYGEDIDLCFRFHENGYKILYTPTCKIIHYKGVASGIKSHSQSKSIATNESKIKALRESANAMRIFYKKHYHDKYPKLINYLVLTTISVLEQIRVNRLKI